MIERRTMWMVDYDHEITSVTALYDVQKSEVVTFLRPEDEEYYLPDNKQFFATEQEAEGWVSERRKYLRDMMPIVKHFLYEMQSLKPSEGFNFKKYDYMPAGLSVDDDYYQKFIQRKERLCQLLGIAASRQLLCVSGRTIPVDRVRMVKWFDCWADVVINDGSYSGEVVTVDNKEELELIRILFGDNASSKVFRMKE